MIDRKGRNLDTFLATDGACYDLKYKAGQFVKVVSKAARTRNPEYTLGQMNTILSIMKEDQTIRISPLLQGFKVYLDQNTEAQKLLDEGYIDKVNDIVKQHRELRMLLFVNCKMKRNLLIFN